MRNGWGWGGRPPSDAGLSQPQADVVNEKRVNESRPRATLA